MPSGDDRLAIAQLLLRVRDDECDGVAVRTEVREVARGLSVGKVILGVRARLDDEDAEGGVCVREAACDETTRRSAYTKSTTRQLGFDGTEGGARTASKDQVVLGVVRGRHRVVERSRDSLWSVVLLWYLKELIYVGRQDDQTHCTAGGLPGLRAGCPDAGFAMLDRTHPTRTGDRRGHRGNRPWVQRGRTFQPGRGENEVPKGSSKNQRTVIRVAKTWKVWVDLMGCAGASFLMVSTKAAAKRCHAVPQPHWLVPSHHKATPRSESEVRT